MNTLYKFTNRRSKFFVLALILSTLVIGCMTSHDAYLKGAYLRGESALNAGNYDLALEEFSAAIEMNNKNANAYFYRAMAYTRRGNQETGAERHRYYDLAIADYGRVLDLEPFRSSLRTTAYANLGNIHLVKGNYSSAETYLNLALGWNPDFPYAQDQMRQLVEALYRAANSAAANSDYTTAIDQYRSVLRIDPNHVNAGNNLVETSYRAANSAVANSDYTTAMTLYRSVLEMDPTHVNARNNLREIWNSRMAESQSVYPSPFEGGFWGRFTEIIIRPDRYVPGLPRMVYHYSHGTIVSEGFPSRIIPALTISAIDFYIFSGNNYFKRTSDPRGSTSGGTLSTATRNVRVISGTFYYNGDVIELEDGEVLRLTEDGILGLTFSEMENSDIDRIIETVFRLETPPTP